MPEQQPSIGRVVHYQSYGTPGGEFLPVPRAAIITAIHTSDVGSTDEHDVTVTTIDAAVLNPTGLFFAFALKFSDEPKPGHWNWPPRV